MKSSSFFLLLLFSLNSCTNSAQPNDPIPAHDTFNIASKIVGETRVINVWTPPQYATDSVALPVMYMADGGIKEDFPHIANTMAELIAQKKIPPFILVGIENTQRRRDLSGPTSVKSDKKVAPVVGKSAEFRAFISDELFPEIAKRYRVSGKRGILGESLSGLFVVETFFLKPELFDYYIAFDPSLWWNDHELVKKAPERLANFPTGKKLWFASSRAEDIAPFTRELSDIIKKAGNVTWAYSHEPKEEHHTIFRATKEKALIWTLNR